VRLKEHGAAELGLDGENGGVEALEVAGLEDFFLFPCQGNEVVGFSEGGGKRLFDEQVEPGMEQRGGYRVVMDGGNGDGGGVETEVRGEQRGRVWKNGDGVSGSGVGGAGGVGLDGGDQGDSVIGDLQLTVDAKVVAAEGAGAGNGDTEDGLACYFAAPAAGSLPSTALRQRL